MKERVQMHTNHCCIWLWLRLQPTPASCILIQEAEPTPLIEAQPWGGALYPSEPEEDACVGLLLAVCPERGEEVWGSTAPVVSRSNTADALVPCDWVCGMGIASDSPVLLGSRRLMLAAPTPSKQPLMLHWQPRGERKKGDGGVEERRGNKQRGATQALLGVEEQPTSLPLH